MFALPLWILVISAVNSLGIQAQIPTHSIDYWIGNISPRCAINIIYYKRTKNFTFKSSHNIPVMFAPIKYYSKLTDHGEYLQNHKFYDSSLRFLKAECYFSILYYKPHSDEIKFKIDHFLFELVNYIAYGFPNYNTFDSNSTYCLILYHENELEEGDKRFYTLSVYRMEMNLALVFLSNVSNIRYNVYCKTPSLQFEVATKNVVNKFYSIVDQKFINVCSSQYKLVNVNENDKFGVYDRKRLDYEHRILRSILLKANLSVTSEYNIARSIPRIIVSDFEHYLQPLSLFVTFDNSVRFFTCYSIPALSFHFYVSAFQFPVWIGIILSGILLAAFLKCHIYYNIRKTLNFSTLLFYFSICMEETYNIPSQIGNNKVYRAATILWLLTAIVLTNTYISHVISGLNAPLTGEKLRYNELYGNSSKEITAQNLVGILMILRFGPSRFLDGYLNIFLETLHRMQTLVSGYTILSEPVELRYPADIWLHLENPYIYKGFHDNLLQIRWCDEGYFPTESLLCRTLIRLTSLSNKHYPAGHTKRPPWKSRDYLTGTVEEELINCQKSVYMERSNQMEFKYKSENYRKKRFYYLTEKFPSIPSKWGFYNLQKSKVPFYFSMFLQSGIFHAMHKFKLLRNQLKRRPITSEIIKRTNKPAVLDMSSSVQTVFILFAAMTLLSKLAFLLELVHSACNKNNMILFKRKVAEIAFGSTVCCHVLYKQRHFKVKLCKNCKKEVLFKLNIILK